jgi:hypothetical protein
MGVPFAQYVGTPDRQEMNLIRIFLEDHDCDSLNSILSSDGQAAVTDEMMARLRAIFSNETIPDPLDGYYRYEQFAYQLTRPGAGFLSGQLYAWAKEPIPGEKICMVSEGFDALNSGWQDGAVTSAHNCFRGKVFQDLYQPGDVQKWERCSNRFTNRDLIKGNAQSTNDLCLLLENEYHMRDLAGLNYCGGPTVMPTEVVNGEEIASASADDWEGATTSPIISGDDETAPRRVNRYQIA